MLSRTASSPTTLPRWPGQGTRRSTTRTCSGWSTSAKRAAGDGPARCKTDTAAVEPWSRRWSRPVRPECIPSSPGRTSVGGSGSNDPIAIHGRGPASTDPSRPSFPLRSPSRWHLPSCPPRLRRRPTALQQSLASGPRCWPRSASCRCITPAELRLGPRAGDLVAYVRAGYRFSDPRPFIVSGGAPVVRRGLVSAAPARTPAGGWDGTARTDGLLLVRRS